MTYRSTNLSFLLLFLLSLLSLHSHYIYHALFNYLKTFWCYWNAVAITLIIYKCSWNGIVIVSTTIIIMFIIINIVMVKTPKFSKFSKEIWESNSWRMHHKCLASWYVTIPGLDKHLQGQSVCAPLNKVSQE